MDLINIVILAAIMYLGLIVIPSIIENIEKQAFNNQFLRVVFCSQEGCVIIKTQQLQVCCGGKFW